jgi:uncharacterized protein YndB with AHSA1/START domain
VAQSESRVHSHIDSSYNSELVLIQEFDVNVPLDDVWKAYTTKEGWEGAFVEKAEVDWKVGGLIKTTYDPNATIGDSTTIYLTIVNYVPKRLITLQANVSDNFKVFTDEEAKDLYNVVQFEEISATKTKVISYGIGYKNNQKFKGLMKFFIQGNEISYLKLIEYLEGK